MEFIHSQQRKYPGRQMVKQGFVVHSLDKFQYLWKQPGVDEYILCPNVWIDLIYRNRVEGFVWHPLISS